MADETTDEVKCVNILWPALERGHGEERQHSFGDIIKVEITVLPFA